MTNSMFLRTIAMAAALASLVSLSAQGESVRAVPWRADTTTAQGITGDIRLGKDQLAIGARVFPLAFVRDLTRAEAAETADLIGASGPVAGGLYTIDIPAGTTFRNGNVLCNGATTRIIAVERTESARRRLDLVAFEGDREIYFSGWKTVTGHVCGTFGYSRS